MPAAALSNQPTLRKLGAHLRWLLEKSGVDPEQVIVSIGVRTQADKSHLTTTLQQEYEPSSMKHVYDLGEAVEVHGVKLIVVVSPPKTPA